MFELNPWFITAYLLMLVGLTGTVLPRVPGTEMIMIGAIVWAFGDGFERIGVGALGVLMALEVITATTDLFLAPAMSRRAGASWPAIIVGIICGVVGGIYLSALPVLGTFTGAIAGAMIGMWLVEYLVRDQDARSAWRAVWAYLSGSLISIILEAICGLAMITIFFWAAFVV